MSNKDGIVKIGFDYKSELREAIRDIEEQIKNIKSSINLFSNVNISANSVKSNPQIEKYKADFESLENKLNEFLDVQDGWIKKVESNGPIKTASATKLLITQYNDLINKQKELNASLANTKSDSDAYANISAELIEVGRSIDLTKLKMEALRDLIEGKLEIDPLNPLGTTTIGGDKWEQVFETEEMEVCLDSIYNALEGFQSSKVIKSFQEEVFNLRNGIIDLPNAVETINQSSSITLGIGFKPIVDKAAFKSESEKLLESVKVIKDVMLSPKPIDDFGSEAKSKISKKKFDLDKKVTLKPVLSDTFETDANALLDTVSLSKEVVLTTSDKSSDELTQQLNKWRELQEKFANSFKSNGSFKSGALQELLNLYKEYQDLGGTNTLSLLEGQEQHIQKLVSKYEELTNSAEKASEATKVAVQTVPETNGVRDASLVEASKLSEVSQEEIASIRAIQEEIRILTQLIGETKVEAIDKEQYKMHTASEAEIRSIGNISSAVENLINHLRDIEPQLQNLRLDSINKTGDALKNLKIPSSYAENIKKLSEAIKALVNGFNKLNEKGSLKDNALYKQLTKLLSKSDELRNMAEVLKNFGKADILAANIGDAAQGKNLKSLYDAKQTNLEQILKLYKEINAEMAKSNSDLNKINSDKEVIKSIEERNAGIQREIDAIKESGVEDNRVSAEKINNLEILKNQEEALLSAREHSFRLIGDAYDNGETEKINNELAVIANETSDVAKATDGIEESLERANEESVIYRNNLRDIKKATIDTRFDANGNIINRTATAIDTAGNSYRADLLTGITNEKAVVTDLSKAYSDLNRVVTDLDGYKKRVDQSSQYKILLSQLEKIIEEIYSFIGTHSGDINTEIYADGLKNLVSQAKDASQAMKDVYNPGSTPSDRVQLLTTIYQWMSKNTKAAGAFNEQLTQITNALNNDGANANVKSLAEQFNRIKAATANSGLGGLSAISQYSQSIQRTLEGLIARFLSLYRVIGYIKSSVQTVRELDDALIDLSKTAKMTTKELDDFYLDSSDLARQMGVTTKAIIDQAAAWSRLGYNTAETASQMALLSSKFASISPGMDTDEAQSGLVSVMKAWDVDTRDVEREIMDKINILGNNFAESNADLVTAIEKVGATLAVQGTSIDDALALITGAQEVVQNADIVGTALKTLSLRIRGYDEETEELSEDVVAATGKVADLTKVASNNFQGVSLWTDATQTQYKPLLEYLREISEIWDEIEAKDQTKLLENLFGKRGATVGSSILLNFEQVEAALEQMEESAGSADKEMEKIRNSISYKINDLQQLWVGFIKETFSRDAVKGAVDVLTSLSEGFIKVLRNPVTGVPAITGIAAAIIKIGSASKGATSGVTKLSTAIRSMLGMSTGADFKNILDSLNTQIINDAVAGLKGLDKANAMAALSTMSLTDAQKVQILSMAGLDTSYAELLQKEQAENIQKVLNKSTTLDAAVASRALSVEKAREAIANGECSVAEAALVLARQKNISVAEAEALITGGLSGKVTVLITKYRALAATMHLPVAGFTALLGVLAAVATASVLLYKQYKKEKEYADNLADSVKTLVGEYENQQSTIKKNASSAKSMYDEYNRLAKGVGKFGNNLSLSIDDFEKYKKLSNEIGDLFPNLIAGYSDTGDAILKCKDNVAALNEELEKQSKSAYRTIIDGTGEEGSANADTIMENFRTKVYGQDGRFVDIAGAKADKTLAKQYTEDIQELSETLKKFKFEDIDSVQGNNYLYYYSMFLNDFKGDTEKAAEYTANMFQDVGNEVLDLYEKVAKLMYADGGADLGYIAPWASTEAWQSYEEIVRETSQNAFDLADKSEADIQAALRDVKKLGDAYLHLYYAYDNLSNDQAKAVSSIIQNISTDTLESLEISTKEELESYIHGLVDKFKNSDVSNAIVGLFEIPPDAPIIEAQNTAQEYLDALKGKIDDASLDILTGLFDHRSIIDTLTNAVGNALTISGDDEIEAAKKFGREFNKLMAFAMSLPEGQVAPFLEYIAQMEEAVTEAMPVIEGYKESVDIAAKGYGFSFKNVATVTDGLEKISAKYDELMERIESGATDIERAFSVSDINDLIDALGLDLAEDELKNIEQVLTGGAASGDDMIAVLEQLATAWVNAKLAVGEYNDEEKQNLATQLVMAGIAEDVAKAFAEDRNTPLKFGGNKDQSILGFSYKNISEVVGGLDSIKSHYDDLVGRIEDGAVGEDLALSITDVVKLIEDLELDLDDEEVAHLVDTLTSGTASADEMKGALNELATTWARTTLAATGYSDEQKQLVSTQLQGVGATKESADKFVDYISELGKARDWVAENGLNLSNMTKKDVVALGQEAKEAGVTSRALNMLYQETIGLATADVALEFGTEDATEEIKTVYDNIAEVAEGLESISSLYQEFVEKVDDGEIGRGLAMEISDIQKLFDKENGLDLGFSDEDIDRLTNILGSGQSSAEEIEAAFNEIATAWVKASFAAEGYSEDVEQLLITQLKLSGATEESAEEFVRAIAAGEEAVRLILDNGKSEEAPTFGFSYENLNDVIDGIGQIKSLYDEFEQKVEDGEVGKKLAADIDDVVKLFDKDNGLKFDLPEEEIARIKETLTSGNASVEEYREAFNELATALAKATLATGDFSDVEKEQIATQLENAGMTRESAEAFAALVSELKEAQTATLEYSSALDTLKDSSVSFEQNIADVGDGIEKIASLYKDFESKVSDGKIGQELAADMSEVLSLFDKDNGLDFGLSDEKIKQLQATLTSGASSAEEMQAAFDELATAWVNASLAAGDYSEEQQQIIATQLEMAGITRESAEEYVQALVDMQEARQWLIDQGYDLANATEADVQAMANEAEEAGISKLALYELRIAELDLSNTAIYTDQVCEEIYNIAVACGASIEQLNSLKSALNGAKAGASALAGMQNATTASEFDSYNQIYTNAQNSTNDVTKTWNDIRNGYRSNLNFSSGGASGGGGGGAKETADAIVSAFEDEYNALKELLDQGKIDQYQYLQYLRALYTKYFNDKKKYLKQYEQYEREYLQGMKSMYESAFSFLTKKIDARISALNAQRSAAVAALEAERDAAIAAIDAQIDAIEEQIDAIDDKIDAYNDEIDAINKANEARQREITLQKALLELNKAQDQRTNLVYSESGGMHYEANRTSLRDVQQAVQEAKDEIEIANIRNKIDLLEDEKKALEDQREELEKQKDEINKYYDQLIRETEAYYDALIENLEKTKSIIEEILDIEEEAKMRAMLADLGVQDVDALISAFENGDLSVVEQFKNDYIGILTDMYRQNDHMVAEISKISNIDIGNLPSYLEKFADSFERIEGVDFSFAAQGLEACRAIDEVLGGVLPKYHDTGMNLGKEVTAGVGEGMNSAESVQALTEASGDVKEQTETALKDAFIIGSPSQLIADNVGKFVGQGVAKGMVEALGDAETHQFIQEFVTKFSELLAAAFKESFDLNSIINGGEEGANLEALTTLSSIFDTISEKIAAMQESLNGINLEPVIMSFQALGEAVNQVVSSISGGGEEGLSDEGGAISGSTGSGQSGQTKKEGSGEGGASSLTSAMEEFGTTASEVIVGGEGGEGEGEGEAGGVVGQFGQLRDAVMEASSAIGTGDDESDTMFSPSSGEGEEAGTLIAAHKALAEVVDDEEVGLPHHISQWEKVIEKIQEATEKLIEFAEEIAKLAAQSPYEIHIIYEAGGSFTGLARGTLEGAARAGGSVKLSGAAFAGGQAGLKKNEDALVGELGPEMLIRNGRWSLVGLGGAEFKRLRAGDIILSAEQTEEILKHGKLHGRGTSVGGAAHADGTPLNRSTTFVNENMTIDAINALSARLVSGMTDTNASLNTIERDVSNMANNIANISNNANNSSINITIGDIHLSDVQNVDGFAKAIKAQLPGKILQELHK